MSLLFQFFDEICVCVFLLCVIGCKVVWDQCCLNQVKGDWWVLCLFYGEKIVLFYVDDQKGFYYCFGCYVKGDVLIFLCEVEGMSFMEVVELMVLEVGLQMFECDFCVVECVDCCIELVEVMEQVVCWFWMQFGMGVVEEVCVYLKWCGFDGVVVE